MSLYDEKNCMLDTEIYLKYLIIFKRFQDFEDFYK